MATLSDEALAGALRDAADPRFEALVDEFMNRHGAWLKGRCRQLARQYWRGDADFAEEVFARCSEKLARQRLFAGLREPDRWRGFLSTELDHQAQNLARFLRAARRDRRAEDGTAREVPIDDAGGEPEAPADDTPLALLMSRENVAAVRQAIHGLARIAAARTRVDAAREIYHLQIFVRVILQGHSRKDLALAEMTRAGGASGMDGARKRIERAVTAGASAIADALERAGHHELAQSFREYLHIQTATRGRSRRTTQTSAVAPEQS